MLKKENVLIFLTFENYCLSTIKRGYEIAQGLKAGCKVLLYAPNQKENDLPDFNYMLAELKEVCSLYNIPFAISEYQHQHQLLTYFNDLEQKGDFTQIILAREEEDWLADLFHDSITSYLLKHMPSVDVIFVNNKDANIPLKLDHYDNGIKAFLTRKEELNYVEFTRSENVLSTGIFFKRKNTDFNNGMYVDLNKQSLEFYRVNDGTATKVGKKIRDFL